MGTNRFRAWRLRVGVVTEDQLYILIKKVLWDYKQCNLQSNAVRERITNEIKRDIKVFVCREQENNKEK